MITQARLKELLTYAPESGVFTWNSSGSGRILGQAAGSPWSNGHRSIRIEREDYQAQRLAWLYVHGEFPAKGRRIRFVNGNPLDCSINNLRLGRTRAEHNRLYHEKFPEANRRANMRRYEGMSIDVFSAMLAEQGEVCAICRQPETATRGGKVRELCVDHDHATDEVRGLLCVGCNTAIGYAQDDPDILIAAAAYLERHLRKAAA